eukprot:6797755-Prymnesium_polylepis.1
MHLEVVPEERPDVEQHVRRPQARYPLDEEAVQRELLLAAGAAAEVKLLSAVALHHAVAREAVEDLPRGLRHDVPVQLHREVEERDVHRRERTQAVGHL